MNQETFNDIVKALVFASTVDCIADVDTLTDVGTAIERVLEDNPELVEDMNLDGISLFGNIEHSMEPEIYKRLVSMLGDKLKIEES